MSETVIASSRYHPIVAIMPFATAITITVAILLTAGDPLGVLVLCFALTVYVARFGPPEVAVAVGLVALILGIAHWSLLMIYVAGPAWALATYHFAAYWKRRFVLTNQRIYEESGIFSEQVASQRLRALTDMTLERPLLGLMGGWIHLRIESAGQDQALTELRYIPGVRAIQPDGSKRWELDYYYNLFMREAQQGTRKDEPW